MGGAGNESRAFLVCKVSIVHVCRVQQKTPEVIRGFLFYRSQTCYSLPQRSFAFFTELLVG
jgi:hypothetical protein